MELRALLARVSVHPDAGLTARYPSELATRITIRTKGGSTFAKEQFGYEGGLADPMSWSRTVEKFHWLSEPFADAAHRALIIEGVQHLDERPLADLTDLLAKVHPSRMFPATHHGI